MKAEDPTIKIGINGNSRAWYNAALNHCITEVDFLDHHEYPLYVLGEGGFDAYSKFNLNLATSVKVAQDVIDAMPSPHKERFTILFTETSAATFGKWDDNGADIAHAIAAFDILAQLVSSRNVKVVEFWNTRYTGYSDLTPNRAQALFNNNELTANGLAIAALSKNLLKTMVATTSTSTVRTFASFNSTTNELNLFLINKSRGKIDVTFNLTAYAPSSSLAEHWILKGKTERDFRPTFSKNSNLELSNKKVVIPIDGISVSVVKLK